MQPTKEQLIEAANRLLNCFENIDRWPKLSVALSKKTWYVAPVDDTMRDAIRHLEQTTLKQRNLALIQVLICIII
ncbi:unnamed protein product [marine sediment metagenome]|uniref:Uncharacterized protein n=1 Tax=marine sediment metagenome TaxID=412755 RepID=X1RD62_9ZZZZ